jgi:AcrR family transcriptional regulator
MIEEFKNILERVRSLYLKYGVKSITMDDVARELGISKKTLYQYVADKTELVAKVLEYDISLCECSFDKLIENKHNAVEEMIEVHKYINNKFKEHNSSTEYDLKKYYPELFKAHHEKMRKKMYEGIVKNIKKGKEEGLYRTEINESIIAKMLVSRNEGFIESELFSANEFMSHQFFKEVLIYHIRGISNEKGIKILMENIEKFEE